MATHTLTLSALNARRLPDENVFDRTLRGDPVAFSEVYRRYQKRIYGFCLARSMDPDTAADATQEVFMKLLRAEPGSIENPRAWLFTVARNVVIDVARKRHRTPEDSGIEEESLAWDKLRSADTADEVLARSDARNVFLALRTLRPRYRTALIMREVHGQSSADMAEALETTPGAIDTLVSRARDAFGVAYASVGDLPAACRASVELVYRKTGTGITEAEQASLDAHLGECARCRAEAKRAENPKHLGALLPFLLPVNKWAQGLLHRAAMTVRTFPDVAVQQTAPVLTQPHTWNLATKIAAGLIAVALITAPIAATTARHTAAASANATMAAPAASTAPGSATSKPGGSSGFGTFGQMTAPGATPRSMNAGGMTGGTMSGSGPRSTTSGSGTSMTTKPSSPGGGSGGTMSDSTSAGSDSQPSSMSSGGTSGGSTSSGTGTAPMGVSSMGGTPTGTSSMGDK